MEHKAKCGFCHRGAEEEQWLGKLHFQDLPGNKFCAAHKKCMQYSAGLIQFKFTHFGGFKINHVEREIRRGQKLRCHVCKEKKASKTSGITLPMTGATSGCADPKCRRTFHYPCIKLKGLAKRLECSRQDAVDKKIVFFRVYCSETHYENDKNKLSKTHSGCCSGYSSNSEGHFSETDTDNPDSQDTPLGKTKTRTPASVRNKKFPKTAYKAPESDEESDDQEDKEPSVCSEVASSDSSVSIIREPSVLYKKEYAKSITAVATAILHDNSFKEGSKKKRGRPPKKISVALSQAGVKDKVVTCEGDGSNNAEYASRYADLSDSSDTEKNQPSPMLGTVRFNGSSHSDEDVAGGEADSDSSDDLLKESYKRETNSRATSKQYKQKSLSPSRTSSDVETDETVDYQAPTIVVTPEKVIEKSNDSPNKPSNTSKMNAYGHNELTPRAVGNIKVKDALSKLRDSKQDTIYLGTSEEKAVVLQLVDKLIVHDAPDSPSSDSSYEAQKLSFSGKKSNLDNEKPVTRRLSFSQDLLTGKEIVASTPKKPEKQERDEILKSPLTPSAKKFRLSLKRKHLSPVNSPASKKQATASKEVDEKAQSPDVGRRRSPRNSQESEKKKNIPTKSNHSDCSMSSSQLRSTDLALVLHEPSDLPEDVWHRRVKLILKSYKGHKVKFWEPPDGFQEEFMIHLMSDLSTAILQRNARELSSLLTRLDHDRMKMYNATCSYWQSFTKSEIRRMEEEMRKISSESLKRSSNEGTDMGLLVPIEANGSGHVMVLFFDSKTDPNCYIRQNLFPKEPTIVKWTPNMKLIQRNTNNFTSVEDLQENEFTAFKSKILDYNSRKKQFDVYSYPKDEITMLKSDLSVSRKLKSYFKDMHDVEANAKLLFIEALNPEIVILKQYLKSLLLRFTEDYLTALNDLYVVMDLPVGFSKLEDLIPPIPDGISFTAEFGVDANTVPATCVLLHYFL